MKAKRIEISTVLGGGFNQIKTSKQLNVSRITVHQVEQLLKDRPRSGRLQVIRHKAIKKPIKTESWKKMTRLIQKKKFSVSTVSRMVKKMEQKSVIRSRKLMLSAANVQKSREKSTSLLNDLKIHWNQILILSDEKTFPVAPVFNKLNNRGVTFGNDVSEHRRLPTTKYTASIMMLGVVASNWEKIPPVWFQRGYRLTSAVYNKVL